MKKMQLKQKQKKKVLFRLTAKTYSYLNHLPKTPPPLKLLLQPNQCPEPWRVLTPRCPWIPQILMVPLLHRMKWPQKSRASFGPYRFQQLRRTQVRRRSRQPPTLKLLAWLKKSKPMTRHWRRRLLIAGRRCLRLRM
jgi:hypothetical protein